MTELEVLQQIAADQVIMIAGLNYLLNAVLGLGLGLIVAVTVKI